MHIQEFSRQAIIQIEPLMPQSMRGPIGKKLFALETKKLVRIFGEGETDNIHTAIKEWLAVKARFNVGPEPEFKLAHAVVLSALRDRNVIDPDQLAGNLCTFLEDIPSSRLPTMMIRSAKSIAQRYGSEKRKLRMFEAVVSAMVQRGSGANFCCALEELCPALENMEERQNFLTFCANQAIKGNQSRPHTLEDGSSIIKLAPCNPSFDRYVLLQCSCNKSFFEEYLWQLSEMLRYEFPEEKVSQLLLVATDMVQKEEFPEQKLSLLRAVFLAEPKSAAIVQQFAHSQ